MNECVNEWMNEWIGKWIPDVLLLSLESEGSPSFAKKKKMVEFIIRYIYVGILCFESEVFNFLFSNFSFKRLVLSYLTAISLLPRGKDYSIMHQIQ
jgi:hypothetical protein